MLETTKAEPQGSTFVLHCGARHCIVSDCSSAADEVHDDGDHGEEEQQVNEEAAHMQDEEAAKPEQNQHNSENEKHERPSFLERFAPPCVNGTSHRSRDSPDSLLRFEKIGVRQVSVLILPRVPLPPVFCA